MRPHTVNEVDKKEYLTAALFTEYHPLNEAVILKNLKKKCT